MKPKISKNQITRFHALKILEWCKSKFGRGKQNYPSLQFRKPNYLNNEFAMGEYDHDEGFIYINKNAHSTLKELANTIIHEYIHYRFQGSESQKISLLDYESDPLEIQANKYANQYQLYCIRELKKYFKQFN